MMFLRVRDDRHRRGLPDAGPLEDRLARDFPRDDLFVYWHAWSHNWMISKWMNRTKRLASELVNLGRVPRFTSIPQYLELCRKVRSPLGIKEMKDTLRAHEQHQKERQDDARRETKELQAKALRDFCGVRENGRVMVAV